jgi:hypothetical protein
MSDEEFLKRWSRRKQEAKVGEKSAEQGSPAPETTEASPAAPPEPEIDLAKLPPIDSIDAATDITAFLQKGIPAELGRAALRRAWAADPAIRDFVGLAENAWDFTDPNAMPGFGPLQGTPEQIGAMVERVVGGARDAAEKLANLPEKEQVEQKSDQEPAVSVRAEARQAPENEVPSPPAQAERVAAAQPEASEEDGDVTPIRRRTHGSALPN